MGGEKLQLVGIGRWRGPGCSYRVGLPKVVSVSMELEEREEAAKTCLS